jgi:hypothetical protein
MMSLAAWPPIDGLSTARVNLEPHSGASVQHRTTQDDTYTTITPGRLGAAEYTRRRPSLLRI